MKKIIQTLLFVLSLLFSVQSALADDLFQEPPGLWGNPTPSKFYGGVGMAQIDEGSFTLSNEETYHMSQTNSGTTHTEKTTSYLGNYMLGHHINDWSAIELSYLGGGRGASSVISGNQPTLFYNFDNFGNIISATNVIVPFDIKQSLERNITQLSYVGSMSANESVRLTGEIGLSVTQTKWVRCVTFAYPTSMGGDGSSRCYSKSENNDGNVIGFGISAKVIENKNGPVTVNFKVKKYSFSKSFVPSMMITSEF